MVFGSVFKGIKSEKICKNQLKVEIYWDLIVWFVGRKGECRLKGWYYSQNNLFFHSYSLVYQPFYLHIQ